MKVLELLKRYTRLSSVVKGYSRKPTPQLDNPYKVIDESSSSENKLNSKLAEITKSEAISQEKLKKLTQPIKPNEPILTEDEEECFFNDMEFYSAVFELEKSEFESHQVKKECLERLLEESQLSKDNFHLNKEALNNSIFKKIKENVNTRKIMLEIFITLINMQNFTVSISGDVMITEAGNSQDLSIFSQIESKDFKFPKTLKLGKHKIGDKVVSLNTCIGFEKMLFLTSFFDGMTLDCN